MPSKQWHADYKEMYGTFRIPSGDAPQVAVATHKAHEAATAHANEEQDKRDKERNRGY